MTSPGPTSARGRMLLALDRADREAREVIVAAMIHAGHLGGLAADEGAARLPAAFGDAGDHIARLFDLELAGGEIVEEEQRLGPLHDEVVDRHGDEIDADRRMQARIDGDLQLGADPVIGGDQTGSLKPQALRSNRPPKPPSAESVPVRAVALRQRLDRLDQRVSGRNIDPRIGIGDAVMAVLFACAHAASLPQ